ncbi:g2018 [Coccomyxa viridis]|uniref:G2018 protein n=1 Tax=Coccomyxa viridis TaxID=1274662 RepID=A0ABP1FR92_9CHLO
MQCQGARSCSIAPFKGPLPVRHASGRPTSFIVLAAKQKQMNTIRERPRARGYVSEDNSGKANIFGVEPRQLYTSSPTSDSAARQGLGGQLGLLILVGCIAAVGAASLFSREAGPQTLAEVSVGAESRQSLSSLSDSFKSSL